MKVIIQKRGWRYRVLYRKWGFWCCLCRTVCDIGGCFSVPEQFGSEDEARKRIQKEWGDIAELDYNWRQIAP